MVSVDNDAAIRLLEREPYRHLCELMALARNIPAVPRTVFGNAADPDALMLAEEFTHGVRAMFTAYDGPFLRECLRWLHASHQQLGLASTDKRVLLAPEVAESFTLGGPQFSRCFVCLSPHGIPPVMASGGKLTPADTDAVARYPQPRWVSRYHPGLSQFFEWEVLEGKGEVFAIWGNGEIAGYLSCTPDYRDIWNVNYIHVREDCRGRGLGTQVAALYAGAKLASGQVPYYSQAANEASERTALKAGFVCCREDHWAEAARR